MNIAGPWTKLCITRHILKLQNFLSSGPARQVRKKADKGFLFGAQCEPGMSVSLGVEKGTNPFGARLNSLPDEPQHDLISILLPKLSQGTREPTET